MTTTLEKPKLNADELIALAKLKAELSINLAAIAPYRALIGKILQPSEILTPEECDVVLSKEFPRAINKLAESSAKVAQWYEAHGDFSCEDAIAFLGLPQPILEAATEDISE